METSIPFRCPGCGHVRKARPELAGQVRECPKCGTSIKIPDLPTAEAVSIVSQPSRATDLRERGARDRKNMIVAVLFVASLTVGMIYNPWVDPIVEAVQKRLGPQVVAQETAPAPVAQAVPMMDARPVQRQPTEPRMNHGNQSLRTIAAQRRGIQLAPEREPIRLKIEDPDLERLREHLKLQLNGEDWDEHRWWPVVEVADRYESEIAILEKEIEGMKSDIAEGKILVAQCRQRGIEPAPENAAVRKTIPRGATRGAVIRHNASVELRDVLKSIATMESLIRENQREIEKFQAEPPIRLCRLQYVTKDGAEDTVFVLTDYLIFPAGTGGDEWLAGNAIKYFKE